MRKLILTIAMSLFLYGTSSAKTGDVAKLKKATQKILKLLNETIEKNKALELELEKEKSQNANLREKSLSQNNSQETYEKEIKELKGDLEASSEMIETYKEKLTQLNEEYDKAKAESGKKENKIQLVDSQEGLEAAEEVEEKIASQPSKHNKVKKRTKYKVEFTSQGLTVALAPKYYSSGKFIPSGENIKITISRIKHLKAMGLTVNNIIVNGSSDKSKVSSSGKPYKTNEELALLRANKMKEKLSEEFAGEIPTRGNFYWR